MVCAMRVRLDGETGLMDAYLRGDRDVISSVAATKREWLSLMGRGWVRAMLYGLEAWGDEGGE